MTGVAAPAGMAARSAGTGRRRVLVCLAPPPSTGLASALIGAGPARMVRIASTASQLAGAVAAGWPDVVVTDVLTAHGMGALLARLAGHRANVVTVSTVDGVLLRAVVSGLATPPATGIVPRLTGRQLQILGMICDGLTNQQIADRLGIGHDTVKSHISRTRALMAAHSRAHLAALAVRRGLVRA